MSKHFEDKRRQGRARKDYQIKIADRAFADLLREHAEDREDAEATA